MKARYIRLSSRRGLGDIVEAAVKPIAKALKLPCLDDQGKLKPESGCGKRKARLNALTSKRP